MPVVEESVFIARPPEEVFDYLATPRPPSVCDEGQRVINLVELAL